MAGSRVRRKPTVVLLVAAAIAVAAAGCLPDTAPPPTADPYQRAMYDAVNRDRANHGLPPLTFSPKLSVFAGVHSCEMAGSNRLFHSDLPGTLHHNADFAAFGSLGENVILAPAHWSADQLQAAWMGSSNHRANILNGAFNIVGLAVCSGPDGRRWGTQAFGAL